MSEDFDFLFDNSCLQKVLKVNRSLSKEECKFIFEYMQERKPKIMFEFGVQNGCSSKAFVEMSKWAKIDFSLHSWDIIDVVKCIRKDEFYFHLGDITGKEKMAFDKYNPNFVFLDAHPYHLTKNIMEICLERKIDFIAHDVVYPIGLQRTCERTNGFTNLNVETNANWELFLLGILINTQLWHSDYYENDELQVKCVRNSCGLAMIKFKR